MCRQVKTRAIVVKFEFNAGKITHAGVGGWLHTFAPETFGRKVFGLPSVGSECHAPHYTATLASVADTEDNYECRGHHMSGALTALNATSLPLIFVAP